MFHHTLVLIPALAAVLAADLFAQRQFELVRTATLPSVTIGYGSAAGDVDGDGDVDMVVANDHSPNQLFLNDGRGRFTDATAGRLTTPWDNATYRVSLVDIDGDGDLDLLLCNDHDLPNRVHRNNGAGVFTDVSATALPLNGFWSVDQVVMDFDGDRDLDWLTVDTGAGGCHLYLNNGAGVFQDASWTHLPATQPDGRGSAALDLEGDGDLDVLLSSGSGLTILVNQGGARFTAAPGTLLPRSPAGAILAGDVNGDGRADLLLGGGTVLLVNQGGGRFVDVSSTALPVQTGISGPLLDVDGDGDLDLVGNNLLWLNDGQGRFTAANARGPSGLGLAIAADVDGDGDQDLLSLYGVLMNFHRQVSAVNPPRLGGTYVLDYTVRPGYGQAAYAVAPVLAPRATVLAVPGLGTLRVDPAALLFQGFYLVPPQTGRLSLSYPVPNDPALRGGELHVQALVVESPAELSLSGALRDVFQ